MIDENFTKECETNAYTVIGLTEKKTFLIKQSKKTSVIHFLTITLTVNKEVVRRKRYIQN